jgi:hypothetical protein
MLMVMAPTRTVFADVYGICSSLFVIVFISESVEKEKESKEENSSKRRNKNFR